MKNWETLEADVDLILDKHFTSGRSGRTVEKVVVHYNAGDLTVEGCYSVWQTRAASAHYQVESSGRVGQLVWDRDTAWHASDWDANCTSIGIEHANIADGTVTEACLDAGAHLVAAVCKAHGLGRPKWLVNVFPHCHFASTSCPGQLWGTQRDAYIRRAQAWYDAMCSGAAEPAREPDQPEPAETGDFHGGLYRCTVDHLRVRDAPSLSGEELAHYDAGQTVELDDWYTVEDGYVWATYVGYSGRRVYVAVGPHTGKPESDDFLVKV